MSSWNLRKLRDYAREVRAHRLTDAYVVSFPKSGRTWLRVMLAKALDLYSGCGERDVWDPWTLVERGCIDHPRIKFTHDSANVPLRDGKRPDGNYHRYRKKKVVFVARDPRDVVVSYFFQRTKRKKKKAQATLAEFVRDPSWGVQRIVSFMNAWYANRDVPAAFLLVRYEDMHADGPRNLLNMLIFLGLEDASLDLAQRAFQYASFENMRALATSAGAPDVLAPRNEADPESFKMRRGTVGSHIDYMDDETLRFVDRAVREHLAKEFGYADPPVHAPATRG